MSLLGKATIHPVDPELLDHYWPFVSSFLQSAMEHSYGETSLADTRREIANHERQLWVVKYDGRYIAAVVTQVYTTSTGLKVGEITMAGGSRHSLWDHFVDVVGRWFKDQGCEYVDIIGRRGWEKLYQKRGFQVAYVQLRRKL